VGMHTKVLEIECPKPFNTHSLENYRWPYFEGHMS